MPTTTKKVVAKSLAPKKKVAATKVVTKKASSKKTLIYADDVRSFWVCDGQILNSLKALHDAFMTMEKEAFTHHVTKDKNDFADWVEAVLCDGACALDLRKAKTPRGARLVIATHLKSYSA